MSKPILIALVDVATEAREMYGTWQCPHGTVTR